MSKMYEIEKLPRSTRFYSYELPKEDMFNLVHIGAYKAICSRIKKDLSVSASNHKYKFQQSRVDFG